MRKEIHPAILIGALVVVVGIVVYLFMLGLAPHETVIENPNAKIGFSARLEKLRQQQGKAGTPGPAVPNSGPSGP